MPFWSGLKALLGMLVWFGGLSATSYAMEFYVDDSRDAVFADKLIRGGAREIFASGEIDEGTTSAFWQFVSEKGISAATVYLDSPGGALSEGIALGRVIRTLGFSTSVGARDFRPGLCASACAYAYAGGIARFFPANGSGLGLHQFYAAAGDSLSSESAQQISGTLVSYLVEMGVDAKAFSVATEAAPDGMIWLGQQQALALQFANDGKSLPVAEIKLNGLQPYLRVEQDLHDVMTRMLLVCDSGSLSIHYGIVTTPDLSAMHQGFATRSYLELDFQPAWVVEGDRGAEANGSVLWITRSLSINDVELIAQSRTLDGWVDGRSGMRFGTTLDMTTVQDEFRDYGRRCFTN